MSVANPRVSVIMTVYNAGHYLPAAIKSILDQSFSDFELIIIDDGSTDDSLNVIKSLKDERIIWRSRQNKGVPESSNEGIKMARGAYIARQDADDVSAPDRLEKQVKFLDSHPDIDLLGTNYRAVNANDELVFATNLFTHPDDLKLAIVFSNQFGHGSTMMRKNVFEKAGYYDEISIVHDYDLWVRIGQVTKMANLKDLLYDWRYHDKSLSNSDFGHTMEQASDIKRRAFEHWINHRNEYRLLSIHPFSSRLGPVKYFESKNMIFRNMALQCSYHGMRRRALPALLLAVLIAPWVSKTYRFAWTILFNKDQINTLNYE